MREWSFSASAEWVVGVLLVVAIVAAVVRRNAGSERAARTPALLPDSDILSAGGQVAPARPRRHARLLHLHRQLVHLVVELRRREADHVLAVQLLRDARERRREVARSSSARSSRRRFRRRSCAGRRPACVRTCCWPLKYLLSRPIA